MPFPLSSIASDYSPPISRFLTLSFKRLMCHPSIYIYTILFCTIHGFLSHRRAQGRSVKRRYNFLYNIQDQNIYAQKHKLHPSFVVLYFLKHPKVYPKVMSFSIKFTFDYYSFAFCVILCR